MSEPIGLTSDMEDGTMNRYSTMIAVAVVAVLLLALAVDARAGGAGDPMATCVVQSAQGQSLTGKVELTIYFTSGTLSEHVEVTLALQREKSGVPLFFRRILTRPVQVLSPQGMACYVISEFRTEILTRFYGADSGQIISIGDDSITETDGLGQLDPSNANLKTFLANVRIFIR